jgi:glutathione S-transferase
MRIPLLLRPLLLSIVGCSSGVGLYINHNYNSCHSDGTSTTTSESIITENNSFLCRRPTVLHLNAKGIPLGKNTEEARLKGYTCHPRTSIIVTILTYYNISFMMKEYNSLTNDAVYIGMPVVQFVHKEFDWSETHGIDKAMDYAAEVFLRRPLSPSEREWHVFVRDKLCPAMEYSMWRSYSTTMEQLRDYSHVKTISVFRRVVHPRVCGVVLPFKKCRQLRKQYKVNAASFGLLMKEFQTVLSKATEPFLNGKQPGISDLEVYGALQAIRNTSLENTIVLDQPTPKFLQWYSKMKDEVYDGNMNEYENRLLHHPPAPKNWYKW